MRFNFRITKYDPSKRNELGHYLAKDWTSISDIGKDFSGRILTKAEYQRVESSYLESISAFLIDSKIEHLAVQQLEMHGTQFNFRIGQELNLGEVLQISRLSLQEKLWCKLQSPRRAYVHFGYDYYMYIGVSRPCIAAITKAQSLGLFVEPFRSPYLNRASVNA